MIQKKERKLRPKPEGIKIKLESAILGSIQRLTWGPWTIGEYVDEWVLESPWNLRNYVKCIFIRRNPIDFTDSPKLGLLDDERERTPPYTHTKEHKQTLWEVCYKSITLVAVMISWVFAYIQLIKLYILRMCSSLYINYTSIKLLLKKKKTLWAKRNVRYLETVSPGFNDNKPPQLCPPKKNLCFLCSGGLTPTYPTFTVCLIFW